jgi:hypothetical protein
VDLKRDSDTLFSASNSFKTATKRPAEAGLFYRPTATIFPLRFGMAMLQSIYVIAEQERLEATGKTDTTIQSKLFIWHLIDAMEAIFTAPLSVETRHELGMPA